MYIYLASLGNYTDPMGKEINLAIPVLPITNAGGRSGYIADSIGQNNYQEFEEIPSLGIAADALMALCEQTDNPDVRHGFATPAGSIVNPQNLCGRIGAIGPHREEIRLRLLGLEITADAFPEFKENTRINFQYLDTISAILEPVETYKIEKTNLLSCTMAGSVESNWYTIMEVAATSVSKQSAAIMGGAVYLGFQRYNRGVQ